MWTILVLCCVISSYGVPVGSSTIGTTGATVSGSVAPCGKYMYDTTGTFFSPNYPDAYPDSMVCAFFIKPRRKVVELKFPFVDLESSPSCTNDAIHIYDGPDTTHRLLGVLCGRNSSIFYSTTSSLTVLFRSNSRHRYSGFRADYQVVDGGSCKYNCHFDVGNCSCAVSCEYRGICCHDYRDYCPMTTATSVPSCRYSCGQHFGFCSCSSSCQYYGNCCYDYNDYCRSTTSGPSTVVTSRPSCRYNCGAHLGRCSCSSSCQYYGNCCYDYSDYCRSTTSGPSTVVTSRPSCRYNCGAHLGRCSCSSSCQYYGNCCYDYSDYCRSTTSGPSTVVTSRPSCRYNCGAHLGRCSCSSSCQYYGNCCYDYNDYCRSTTSRPSTVVTSRPSCRYYCGAHLGSCSCSSSCQYRENCCHDYYFYCIPTTGTVSPTTDHQTSCGGSLFGSGTFTSPNHPSYYYDNSYCVWQLRVSYNQMIYLAFTYLQLENCCSCDYISVYDGPSLSSRYLGKVCNNSLNTFQSSSNYLTVLFRTDSSVVGRGFKANFMSSLPPSSGRVNCSSDNMNIMIDKRYLNSLGYDGSDLYLNDRYCRPQLSSYWVVFSFPINSCGTVRTSDNGRIVYTNTLRAYTSNYGEITRQSSLKLNVGCQMEQDSTSQIMFLVDHHGNSSIIGTGSFNTTMHFYTSSSFYNKVTQFPYKVSLNQNLYVQVEVTRYDSSLVMFLDTCVASPLHGDFQTRPYYLVRNGCPADNTYFAYVTGTHPFVRFTFKAFQFLRATESVYIQCKVLICPLSDYNSRCRHGCSRRKARDLGSNHDSQNLVLGPIQLKDPEETEEGAHEA